MESSKGALQRVDRLSDRSVGQPAIEAESRGLGEELASEEVLIDLLHGYNASGAYANIVPDHELRQLLAVDQDDPMPESHIVPCFGS